jgi:hypothetical protein
MNKHELAKQVRELAEFRTPAAPSPDGGSVTVPSWCFQELNAGWWRYYVGRPDLPGEEQCAVIAETLETMNQETARDEVRRLPSESVEKARGIDYDLGKHKVRYKEGGSNGDSTG